MSKKSCLVLLFFCLVLHVHGPYVLTLKPEEEENVGYKPISHFNSSSKLCVSSSSSKLALKTLEIMSGVWVFKGNGVYNLMENPTPRTQKVLVYQPTGEVVSSYEILERILTNLGWERYYYDADLIQFHRANTIDLISLPKDFSKFKSVHMFDIVVKVPEKFRVT